MSFARLGCWLNRGRSNNNNIGEATADNTNTDNEPLWVPTFMEQVESVTHAAATSAITKALTKYFGPKPPRSPPPLALSNVHHNDAPSNATKRPFFAPTEFAAMADQEQLPNFDSDGEHVVDLPPPPWRKKARSADGSSSLHEDGDCTNTDYDKIKDAEVPPWGKVILQQIQRTVGANTRSAATDILKKMRHVPKPPLTPSPRRSPSPSQVDGQEDDYEEDRCPPAAESTQTAARQRPWVLVDDDQPLLALADASFDDRHQMAG